MVEIAEKQFCRINQPTLANLLRETGAKILVEAAHYDPAFGVGLQAAVHHPRGKAKLADQSILELGVDGNEIWKTPPGPMWGLNLLGKALMEVRAVM